MSTAQAAQTAEIFVMDPALCMLDSDMYTTTTVSNVTIRRRTIGWNPRSSIHQFFSETYFARVPTYRVLNTTTGALSEERIDSSKQFIVKVLHGGKNPSYDELEAAFVTYPLGIAGIITPPSFVVVSASRIFIIWKWSGISLGALLPGLDIPREWPSAEMAAQFRHFIRTTVTLLYLRCGMVYEDWAARNILYDSGTRQFHLIDFGKVSYVPTRNPDDISQYVQAATDQLRTTLDASLSALLNE